MAEPTPEQFDEAARKVAASAPPGLTREQFNALIESELSKSADVPLAERAARAVEGKGVPGAIRSFGAGAVKGAIEQAQHPFTWGGPQTEKLIQENVPGGEVINEALSLASPGAMAVGGAAKAAGSALAPRIPGAIRAAAQSVPVQAARRAAPVAGAAMGAYPRIKAGDPLGAMEQGALGYATGKVIQEGGLPKSGKIGRVIRALGLGEEAAAGETAGQAVTKGAAGKTTEKATSRLVLTPEEAAAANQQEKLAAMEASRKGMQSAAYGKAGAPAMSPSEQALMKRGGSETGAVSPSAVVGMGAGGMGLAALYKLLQTSGKFGPKNQLDKYQQAVDLLEQSGGSGAIK